MDLVQSDWERSHGLLLWTERSKLTMLLDLLHLLERGSSEDFWLVLLNLSTVHWTHFSQEESSTHQLEIWHSNSKDCSHLFAQRKEPEATGIWQRHLRQRCLIGVFKREDLSTDTEDILTKRNGGGITRERDGERGKPHRAISPSGDDSFHRTFFRTLTGLKREPCNRYQVRLRWALRLYSLRWTLASLNACNCIWLTTM